MGRSGIAESAKRPAAFNPRTGAAISFLSACSLASQPAAAVVVQDLGNIDPPPGYVAYWNGSSAVPIGPHWLISAKHVAGSVDQYLTMRGVNYRCVEIRQHPAQDIELIRVAEELPGYHRIAIGAAIGDPAILGGWGRSGGAWLGNGYDWTGPQQETWGANKIEGGGLLLAVRFDAPASPAAVPDEAIFAVNDSGGGLFVYGADSELELAGVAVSVTNYGSSLYGNVAYSLALEPLYNWIMPIVDPGTPLLSSVVAPRASGILGDDAFSILVGLVGLTAAAGAWRRRRSIRAAIA